MPVKTTEPIKAGVLFRSFEFTRADADAEKRTVPLSFSSEDPVDRWFGKEILDHSKKSVRLDRLRKGGPLLVNHDPRDHVGVLEDVSIGNDRKGRAVVRFGKSPRAEEVFQDVLDGIRLSVSVGYRIHRMVLEEEKKNAPNVYRATDWEPVEVSIVSVPADIAVGVGRGESGDEQEIEVIRRNNDMCKCGKEGPINERGLCADCEAKGRTQPLPAPPVDVAAVKAQATKDEKERVREITAIGRKLKMTAEADKAIDDGTSLHDFRQMVVERLGATPVQTDPDIGLSKKEIKAFSIVRAINAMAEMKSSGGSFKDLAPFEHEVSTAVASHFKRTPQGFFIPHEVQTKDLTVGTATAGGNLVATNLLSGSFIDLLRNRMMVKKLGAWVLGGLIGDVAIPRQTSGATAYWVAESGAPTEGQQAFDQVAMTPKTAGAFTDISRKLLLQSSIDVEAFVRSDLATVLAIAIDLAAINGSGSANQPTGILNATGIGDVAIGANGGAPTYATIVNLWKEIAKDNAAFGTLAYLINSTMIAKLMTVDKTSGGYGKFIIENLPDVEGITSMLGLRTGCSNQVPAALTKGESTDCSAGIIGNWADLIIGEWGALDILVDPYTGGGAGTVRVRVLKDIDIAVRHPESFAACKDMRDV